MKLISTKSCLKGTIAVPASKSHTIRAVAIAPLTEGRSFNCKRLESGHATMAVRENLSIFTELLLPPT
jgi:5-enolpyruvylshikimate-3-phosphate synthase